MSHYQMFWLGGNVAVTFIKVDIYKFLRRLNLADKNIHLLKLWLCNEVKYICINYVKEWINCNNKSLRAFHCVCILYMYIYKFQLEQTQTWLQCVTVHLCTCVLLTCCLRQQQECFLWVVCSSLCCRGIWCNSILFLPPFSLSPSTLNNPTLCLSHSSPSSLLSLLADLLLLSWLVFTSLCTIQSSFYSSKMCWGKKEGIREKEQAILMTGMREERKEIGGGWSANYKALRFSRECHLVRVSWWLVWIAEIKTHQCQIAENRRSLCGQLPTSLFHFCETHMEALCAVDAANLRHKLHNVNYLEAENMLMRYLLGSLPSLLTFSDQSCSLLRFSSNLGVPFTLQNLSIWKVLLFVMALM